MLQKQITQAQNILFYELFKGKKIIATKSVAACFDWNWVVLITKPHRKQPHLRWMI